MKFGKRFRWIVGFAIFLTSLVVFFIQADRVQATFSDLHVITVLLRVETEIMQKTPAGQYYESLFWKHNDEVMRIMQAHPEHNAIFLQATRVFIPELDALLEGEGNKAYITSEHIESLRAELDWFSALGSPALQQDIQKEQKRFPLDIFVGMTMNEALDLINSTWTPDTDAEKTLVPNSDGRWAYYVHNGIYLEYPSNYALQISGSEKDYIYFLPFQGLPEQWDPCVMKVRVWNVPINEKEENNPRSWYSPENILWESAIQNTELPGFEFISSRPGSSDMHFHAFQYNEEKQLAVDIWVFVNENPQFPDGSDYSTMINQRYEYFQHMVDSIKMQPSSISELPAQQTLVPNVTLQTPSMPERVGDQGVVNNSEGKWAYYVHNGVYIEYPNNYYFVLREHIHKSVDFRPAMDFPERSNRYSITVDVWNVPVTEKEELNPSYLYPVESIVWERIVQNGGFEGIEFISSWPNVPVMYIRSIQYDEESQLAVQLSMEIPLVPEDSDYSALINQRYEYFQHMVDNIRLQTP
jgi:hypothetical protein